MSTTKTRQKLFQALQQLEMKTDLAVEPIRRIDWSLFPAMQVQDIINSPKLVVIEAEATLEAILLSKGHKWET